MIFNENKFNVVLQYADGGSDGGGSPVVNLPTQESPLGGGLSVFDSQYKFTDPPRFYKANDPYYFEVDNIPLKQIHENCMWLRDQILGATFEVSGVKKTNIVDLKPSVTGDDRVLRVAPGNFIGRVNSLPQGAEREEVGSNDINRVGTGDAVDIARNRVYKPYGTRISDPAWRKLVGSVTDSVLQGVGNNGLFDHYQHHSVRETSFNSEENLYKFRWVAGGDYVNESQNYTIDNLTKFQTALWQQATTTDDNYWPGQRQLATDFCRRWGGVFRTAVVNVPATLEVIIPEFVAEDYADNDSVYDPEVRIDLVYVYTKSVDSVGDVKIAKREGDGVKSISTPILGIAKGAGGIITARNSAIEIATDPDQIGSADWDAQEIINNRDKYYDSDGGVGGDANLATMSPLADQVVSLTEGAFDNAPTYSFPAPDDLLNLAPAMVDRWSESALETIGQSVLPICYVIVKKNQVAVSEEDIIDIRPFLRTAELAYNERAGLGGANPPLSLANPAVGKSELYGAIELVRDYMKDYIDGLEGGGILSFAVPKPKAVGQAHFLNDDVEQYHISDSTTGYSGQLASLGEVKTASNDISNYPETAPYATATCFASVTNGDQGITMIPGIYEFELDLVMKQGAGSAGDNNGPFYLDLISGDGTDTPVQIYPTTSDDNYQIKTGKVGVGNYSAGGSKENPQGVASLRALVTIPSTTTVKFRSQIRSYPNSAARNSKYTGDMAFSITRISNLDGTETTIR
jgi:hypothetical protein